MGVTEYIQQEKVYRYWREGRNHKSRENEKLHRDLFTLAFASRALWSRVAIERERDRKKERKRERKGDVLIIVINDTRDRARGQLVSSFLARSMMFHKTSQNLCGHEGEKGEERYGGLFKGQINR